MIKMGLYQNLKNFAAVVAIAYSINGVYHMARAAENLEIPYKIAYLERLRESCTRDINSAPDAKVSDETGRQAIVKILQKQVKSIDEVVTDLKKQEEERQQHLRRTLNPISS